MLHLYRSISRKISSTLPAALSVLTFPVAMVMSSLPRSLAPVAHLSFLPWCQTGNAVVVSGRDRSGMDIISFVGGVSWEYLSPAVPTPLQTAGLRRVISPRRLSSWT